MRPWVIAVGWATSWTALLIAAADWPPPPGFVELVPLIAIGAVVVGWRAGAYAADTSGDVLGGWMRAARDGVVAGISLALAVLALPGVAERFGALSVAEWAIYVGMFASVGALNGLAVRALVALGRQGRRS